jgi:hypothetical protein
MRITFSKRNPGKFLFFILRMQNARVRQGWTASADQRKGVKRTADYFKTATEDNKRTKTHKTAQPNSGNQLNRRAQNTDAWDARKLPFELQPFKSLPGGFFRVLNRTRC